MDRAARIARVEAELAVAGRYEGDARAREAFASIVERALDADPYACIPSVGEVFGGRAEPGRRRFVGSLPHYGFFLGPMDYVVVRPDEPALPWRVEVAFALAADLDPDADLELADCDLGPRLGASVRCAGTPFAASGQLEACPGSGTFAVPRTAEAVDALLALWSASASAAWTDDARASGVPVEYRIRFARAGTAGSPPDAVPLPLVPTCGRTPYFASFRSGWSQPIVAHEVGHWFGLLDEYEALSGIAPFYPKTAFAGAERSRMALSMLPTTRFLPLHHWLVLRRYFCAEPHEDGGRATATAAP